MIGPCGRQGPAATLRQQCPQMTQRRCNSEILCRYCFHLNSLLSFSQSGTEEVFRFLSLLWMQSLMDDRGEGGTERVGRNGEKQRRRDKGVGELGCRKGRERGEGGREEHGELG